MFDIKVPGQAAGGVAPPGPPPDHAIYTCLANEKVLTDRAAGRDPRPGIPPCDCHAGEAVQLFVTPPRDGAPIYLPVEV